MESDRKIILNGERLVWLMARESNLQIFTGAKLKTGGYLLDEGRKRLYQITGHNPTCIVIQEQTLDPSLYNNPVPLDHPEAVGNLVEHNPQKILEKFTGVRP